MPDAPFTVIGAEPGAQSISISGCSIDVNQRSYDAGTERLFGTCLGGAADGRACSQICSKPPPGIEVACESDEDCERVSAGKCLSRTSRSRAVGERLRQQAAFRALDFRCFSTTDKAP